MCGRFLFPNRQLFSYIHSNPFSLNNHPSCHCVLCLSLWSGCCQQVYAKSALPQGSIIRLLPFFFRCYFKLVVLLFFSLYSVLNAFFVKLTPLFPFSTSSIIIESFSCSISWNWKKIWGENGMKLFLWGGGKLLEEEINLQRRWQDILNNILLSEVFLSLTWKERTEWRGSRFLMSASSHIVQFLDLKGIVLSSIKK